MTNLKPGTIFRILLVVSAIIFLLDTQMPRGITLAIAYIPLVAIAVLLPRPSMAMTTATVTSAFTLLDSLFSPPSNLPTWITYNNRGLTLGAIWFLAVLALPRVRAAWTGLAISGATGAGVPGLAAGEADEAGELWQRWIYAARRVISWVTRRDHTYRIYRATPDMAEHSLDPGISTYDAASGIPDNVLEQLADAAGRFELYLMTGRMRRNGAVLAVLPGVESIIGYGWIQQWAPLRREFGWLAEDAVCLGPFWVHPSYRGRGVYGRLLTHTVVEAMRRGATNVFIWTDDGNRASAHGIERAGFEPVGRYHITLWFAGCWRKVERLG